MMQSLTAAVLAAFVGYAAAWYSGKVDGNFALLLFMATTVTGAYWAAERLYFLPKRERALEVFESEHAQRLSKLAADGIAADEDKAADTRQALLAQPWWLDWTAGLFPVILVVFVLRSFLFEPFKIPSGSMNPTLLTGDLILVNKFTYGLRLPVLNTKITEGNRPQRGDVMVFRYPPKPSLDYIKRVVGVPGDEVAYVNKRLTINGKPVSTTEVKEFLDEDSTRYIRQFETALGDKRFRILQEDNRPAFVQATDDFPLKQNCRYDIEGVVCKVPAGHYFLMGDNRDNSLDSRYWGFVPEANIVGKAFYVWMNFGNIRRVGGFD